MTRKHNNYCLDPCEVDDITIILVLAAVTPSLGLAFRPQGAPHLGLPPKTRANDKASHDQGTYMHVHVGGMTLLHYHERSSTPTYRDQTAHWISFETTSLLSLNIRQNVPSMLVDRAAVHDKVLTVLSYVER